MSHGIADSASQHAFAFGFVNLLEEHNTGTQEISGREEGPMIHSSRLSHNAVAALSVLSMSGTSFIRE